MAVFYYPDRNTPDKTITVSNLESHPSGRQKDILQGRDVTPGGAAIVYNLGVTIQFLTLIIKNLSPTDRAAIANLIDDRTDGASNTFDFTDDDGNTYDSCRFWFDDYDFRQDNPMLYSESLLIRVDQP
jgi:hypothetical protein